MVLVKILYLVTTYDTVNPVPDAPTTQALISIDASSTTASGTYKFVKGAGGTEANNHAEYHIDYNGIIAIGAETALLEFTDDAINSEPSRNIKFTVYQSDANHTYPKVEGVTGATKIEYSNETNILLHPFKQAANPRVIWNSNAVNVIPSVAAEQVQAVVEEDLTADPQVLAATTNTGVSDNNGWIFQTVTTTGESQPKSSNKYRAVVRKQNVGPTGVADALDSADINDRVMATFLFEGTEIPATCHSWI